MRPWSPRVLFCVLFVITMLPGRVAHAQRHGERILYFTTFKHGLSGWRGTRNMWQVRTHFISTDLSDTTVLVSPFVVRRTNYAVQSKLRVVAWRNQSFHDAIVGILFRSPGVPNYAARSPITDRGLIAGLYRSLGGAQTEVVVKQAYQLGGRYVYAPYEPGAGWNTYRVEVRGNRMQVLVDGRRTLSLTTRDSIRGSLVGLVVSNAAVEVKGFRVATL